VIWTCAFQAICGCSGGAQIQLIKEHLFLLQVGETLGFEVNRRSHFVPLAASQNPRTVARVLISTEDLSRRESLPGAICGAPHQGEQNVY
jgi:hypothetical protein